MNRWKGDNIKIEKGTNDDEAKKSGASGKPALKCQGQQNQCLQPSLEALMLLRTGQILMVV